MTGAAACPRCGVERAADAELDSVCPRCVLALGMDDGDDEDALSHETTAAGESGPAARVGPYRPLELLGEGGMGVVYLAEQERPIRRRVALKLIKPGMDTRQVLARFESERQALARLNHPNVARIHDAGSTPEGRPYFVMEHVAGVPITDYCDAQRLDNRARLGLFVQVCEAIQHAHQKGILHRDVKPTNVLVAVEDGKPVPKVIDFGVAKATKERLTERTLYTEQGLAIGTPEYMSPEQATLSGVDVDTRTDIYSLGVLLYELLAGTLPYDSKKLRAASHGEMQRIIREEEPARPSTRISTLGERATEVAQRRRTDVRTLRRQLRGDLDWITMRALEKDRARRYASASELATDVSRHLADEPVLARPPGTAYRLGKFVRKNRGPVAAALAVFATLVIGIVTSTALYLQATEARRTEAAQRARAERNSYIANLAAAHAGLRDHETAEAKRRLEACPPSLRGWEWRYLDSQTDRSLATLTGHEALVWSVAFSPDGGRIASASRDGTIRIWDASSGTELVTLKGHEDWVRKVAFSPDGERVVSASGDQTVRVWDVATGDQLASLRGHEGVLLSAVYSPDGRLIASGSADRTVRLWDAASGEPVATLEGHTGVVSSVVFSPNGERIVSAAVDMTIRLWEVASGELVGTLGRYEGFRYSIALAFSPDGARVFSGTWDNAIRIWGAIPGEPLGVLLGHESAVTSVAVSPDGARIYSGGQDNTVRIWDAASGENLATLVGHDGWVTSVAISPDGERIASGSEDATVRLWSAVPEGSPRTISAHGRQQVNSVAFSPDSTRIASGSRDKTVRIWDADSGELLRTLEGHAAAVNHIAFSPDGRSIASNSRDETVRVWDVASGRSLVTLDEGLFPTRIAFSPDGERLASGAESRIRIWDLATAEPAVVFEGREEWILHLAYSPDGSQIASAGDGALRLWDAETGDALARWEQPIEWFAPVAYSPDGRRLVSGADDKLVRVWDPLEGRLIARLAGHDSGISAVAVTPDGSRIVSGAESVRIWDLATGDPLLTLHTAAGPVSSLAVSPDGRRIVAGAFDGTLRIWEMPPTPHVAGFRPGPSR